jgi:hypothetical protein
MIRDQAGKGFLNLGVSCVPRRLWRGSVRNGLAKAAITGQRANGFRRLFKTRTSRILSVFGIIREKSMDKRLWVTDRPVGLWASVLRGCLEEELGTVYVDRAGLEFDELSVSL